MQESQLIKTSKAEIVILDFKNISCFLKFLICVRQNILFTCLPNELQFKTMEHLTREIRKKFETFPKCHELEHELQEILDLDLNSRERLQLKHFILNNFTVVELRFNLASITTQIS